MATDLLLTRFDELRRRDASAPVVLGSGGAIDRATVDREADRIAGWVAELAVPADTPVGLLAGGTAFLAGLIGLRRAGRPVLLVDAGTPAAARSRLVRAFGLGGLLRAGSPAAGGPWTLDPATGATRTCPPDTAVVKLSSGTHGDPHGILCTADQLLADVDALDEVMELTTADRTLATLPLSFSYGLASVALPALVSGRPFVVPRDGSAVNAVAAARRYGATFFPAVPLLLESLVRRRKVELPPGLRRVVSAGAPLPPDTARAFERRTGRPIHVFYGASECGGITYDASGQAGARGTVGRPVPGVTLDLEPDSGRVTVRSPAVASGYWPEPDPSLRPGTFLSTDLGRLESGELRLLGRDGGLIDIAGRKARPAEIERVLREMPAVQDAHVWSAEDGRGTRHLAAAVAAPTPASDAATLLAWCRQHLAPWKVPRRVTVLPELPRTPRGKVDREAIEERFRVTVDGG